MQRLIKLEKMCHHFHLSLQSGCDETLKRMNRKYTTKQFADVVKRIRDNIENVNLTTDIIVGFPGETEEEFGKTYNFLKKMDFYKMHVFKYSKRDGTVAAKMQNQVDGNIKEERSKKLIELSNSNELKFNQEYVGKEIEVLFEEKHEDFYVGHSRNYMVVKLKSNETLENKVKKVLVEKAETEYVVGVLQKKCES